MQELLIVAGAHLLAVMSPGPDFALVLKMALVNGRKTALYGAAGVAIGILVHVLYSIVGLALVISQSIVLFNVIKLMGAAYLIWIGINALRSREVSTESMEQDVESENKVTNLQAFKNGFITNVLNPKATLFFLSLFTQVISASTPLWLKATYGLEMAVATFVWFAAVAYLMTQAPVRKQFVKVKHHVDHAFGAVLVALGIKVALGSK